MQSRLNFIKGLYAKSGDLLSAEEAGELGERYMRLVTVMGDWIALTMSEVTTDYHDALQKITERYFDIVVNDFSDMAPVSADAERVTLLIKTLLDNAVAFDCSDEELLAMEDILVAIGSLRALAYRYKVDFRALGLSKWLSEKKPSESEKTYMSRYSNLVLSARSEMI